MIDPMSQQTRLFGARRAAVEAACRRLQSELDQLDGEIAALARRRRELALSLRRERFRLLTTLQRKGRQPAVDGTVALPSLTADARFVSGRRLRAVCLALLHRFGTQPLKDLHVLLHRHGYAVAGRHPVQVLADTLGYELDRGRVRRVARGVYELVAPPPPAVSRLLAA